jgi:hypothetical protein
MMTPTRSEPQTKHSSAEERTVEQIQSLARDDPGSFLYQLLLYANPSPYDYAEEIKKNQPVGDLLQSVQSLKKVTLKKRFAFAHAVLLQYLEVCYEIERKLCLGEVDSVGWYFVMENSQNILVPADYKKRKDDEYTTAMKIYTDSMVANPQGLHHAPPRKHEFTLLGASEVSKMKSRITHELVEMSTKSFDELAIIRYGPKNSYVYNVSDIKVVQFNQTFIEMICSYVKSKFDTVKRDFERLYAEFISENVWLYEPKNGKKGEKIAHLAIKLIDPILALIARFDDSSVAKDDMGKKMLVRNILSALRFTELFENFSDVKTDNLRAVLIQHFIEDRRSFYARMLDLADALGCDPALIRADIIRGALNDRAPFSASEIDRAISEIGSRGGGFSSNRMINAFFSAVTVENLSRVDNDITSYARKKLPAGFEELFFGDYKIAQKMAEVNRGEKDPKKLAYVVSTATRLEPSMERLYSGHGGSEYLPAISQHDHGYRQEFTMSLISAAKMLSSENKPIPIIDPKSRNPEELRMRSAYLRDIECLLVAVNLYKQANIQAIKHAEEMFSKRVKAAQLMAAPQGYGAYVQPAYTAMTPGRGPQSPPMGVTTHHHHAPVNPVAHPVHEVPFTQVKTEEVAPIVTTHVRQRRTVAPPVVADDRVESALTESIYNQVPEEVNPYEQRPASPAREYARPASQAEEYGRQASPARGGYGRSTTPERINSSSEQGKNLYSA